MLHKYIILLTTTSYDPPIVNINNGVDFNTVVQIQYTVVALCLAAKMELC